MKIVNTGNTYTIYEDDLKTYDKLPVKTYNVCFSKMVGFFLESRDNVEVTEKIYGSHTKKVDKIFNAFSKFERNLGVILSGDKGIGKSICAKLMAQKAIKNKLPVIVVDSYIPGIANYISSIKQECVVLFDEFDKTFKNGVDSDEPRGGMSSPDYQTELLTLFDGLDQGKKLFVITCNEIYRLNEFLVNRPGRFHYHLRFDYPNADEIREYLQDKLDKKYYGEIDKVIQFTSITELNYDCLRAIAFEINNGETFEEAIKDLNIVNVNRDYNNYSVNVILSDGSQYNVKKFNCDFYNEEDYDEITFPLNNKTIKGNEYNNLKIEFNPSLNEYDMNTGCVIIKGEAITSYFFYSTGNYKAALYNEDSGLKIKALVFKKNAKKTDIHYAF